MGMGRKAFNPKRKIRENCAPLLLRTLGEKVRYSGSPLHKRNPRDFGLTPPALPRPDKTLCDELGILKKDEAQELLREGVRRGLISEQERNGYPQNIWAVSNSGEPVEAQLENEYQGTYHGYPLPSTDPFRQMVLERWEQQ